jgi:hypothetical protein
MERGRKGQTGRERNRKEEMNGERGTEIEDGRERKEGNDQIVLSC